MHENVLVLSHHQTYLNKCYVFDIEFLPHQNELLQPLDE
jgi:hypothetical protein